MREQDYIDLTDLGKLRSALSVLQQIIPENSSVIDGEGFYTITSQLNRWVDALYECYREDFDDSKLQRAKEQLMEVKKHLARDDIKEVHSWVNAAYENLDTLLQAREPQDQEEEVDELEMVYRPKIEAIKRKCWCGRPVDISGRCRARLSDGSFGWYLEVKHPPIDECCRYVFKGKLTDEEYKRLQKRMKEFDS